ncbi:tRNA (guanosine(46)-N7)-methyltransferase TrmB [Lactiplantibacillus nangangensis]|uniref:tRNA (guanine-N(7)-)-methyltransferase n=1 Tax=Lactiplantibacillus nangangensis TaxID=2559917 RepID=A0ABW1SJS2_9LACO|nr:tRNA (guanosine(46)-N7)-methyltransferase TrmB [Lactiplantibacillus nangangensis]
MRVRNKPWAPKLINAHPELITETPTDFKGKWQSRFKTPQPLQIEVGSGKGQFIIEMAKRHPEINYIAIEIQTSVIAVILRKLVDEPLPNLQLAHADGQAVTAFFEPNEIDRVYLNFSDPWPKSRHAKRRLTYKSFLASYAEVLKPNGQVEFKTDNRGLFEFSLTSMNNFGMQFEQVWLDLHAAVTPEENVETEYEQKFSQFGPIYKIIATFPAAKTAD